eukprot:c28302_g1_i1.p1 GENE.c28302_g1_i1~~c28302_g1_i1.p1  ORF type:complete len:235 (-),score=25.81 c28302_g1_i1:67-771(-)
MCKVRQSPSASNIATIEDEVSHLLQEIVDFNSESIISSENDGVCLSSSPFTESWGYDETNFQDYIEYLTQSIGFDSNSYMYALCLIKKMENSEYPVPITQQTVHRLFFICLSIGYRFTDDNRYADADFANLGCVTIEEFLKMQIWVLTALKFNCFIHEDEIKKMDNLTQKLYLSSFHKYKILPQKKSNFFLTLTSLTNEEIKDSTIQNISSSNYLKKSVLPDLIDNISYPMSLK